MPRPAVALCCALLVVLAGCAAPVADRAPVENGDGPTGANETESSTGEDDERAIEDDERTIEDETVDGLDVRGGSLPFDENRTFDRVRTLLGVEMDPPIVYVEDPGTGPRAVHRDPSSFFAVMGLALPDADDANGELDVGGVASPLQAVYVIPDEDAAPSEVERVLVHELVHAAQFQEDVPRRIVAKIPARHVDTTDGRLTYASLVEGSATYGSSAYTERFADGIDPEDEVLARLYADASPGTRLAWGPYHHGARYIDDRVDAPDDHWAVYDDPPVTMRQVLHGEAGSDRELDGFAVGADADGAWEPTETDVMGEFVVRTILETRLPTDRSADAAAGWEYDGQARFSSDDTSLDGYAWAVRFEDDENASEYEAALADYLEARADSIEVDGEAVDAASTDDRGNATWYADEYAFEVATVDDRTVALTAGAEAFVDRASVESADEGVRVVFAEDETTVSAASYGSGDPERTEGTAAPSIADEAVAPTGHDRLPIA